MISNRGLLWQLILACTISLIPSLLHAQSSTGSENSESEHPRKRERRARKKVESTVDDSSSSVRASKIAGVEILGVLLDTYQLRYGGGAYAQLGQNWRFGAVFLSGSYNASSLMSAAIDNPTTVVNSATINSQAIYGYARYFIRNSFTVTAGLGYRTLKAKAGIDVNAVNSNWVWNASLKSIVVPLGIGNHWAWDNGLTLGCDWISTQVAISGSSTTSSSISNLDQDTQIVNDALKELTDQIAKAPSFSVVVVSVGYLF